MILLSIEILYLVNLGIFLRHERMGSIVKRCAEEFPLLELEASLHPITRTVLRIRLQIVANFRFVTVLV